MTQTTNDIVDKITAAAQHLGKLKMLDPTGALAYETGILRAVLLGIAFKHPELVADFTEELKYIQKHIEVAEKL